MLNLTDSSAPLYSMLACRNASADGSRTLRLSVSPFCMETNSISAFKGCPKPESTVNFPSPAATASDGSKRNANATTLVFMTDLPTFHPVSYTHLRAHETDSYLVCRLLLEKKNARNPHAH